MKTFGDEALLAWPVAPAERAIEIEHDPRTRAEVFVDLLDAAKQMRRLRARLDFIEEENERLRHLLAFGVFEVNVDGDDDDGEVVALTRCS